ncbi:MAG: hypothetical protein AAF456_03980 [Planctomycetota bacterium]
MRNRDKTKKTGFPDIRGGGWLGTKWIASGDSLRVSWPSIYIAPSFGCLGMIGCFMFAIGTWFIDPHKTHRWPWIIGCSVVCSFLLASSVMIRERFTIDSSKVTISRWPAVIPRPERAVPMSNVINAVVRLYIVYGERTRRMGTVKVRVRTPGGIEWWDIGADLTWSESEKLGRLLSRFISVRVQRDD